MVKKDNENSAYYKPEPFPLDVSELNIEAKTKSGLAVKIASQKEATLKRFDKVKNPNLLCLADFENGKVYMKKDDGSLWLLAHSEDGLVWIKLKSYIMKILEALCILYDRNFTGLAYPQIWVKEDVRKLIEEFSSRIPHEITVLFSNLISVRCPFCSYVKKLNFQTIKKVQSRKSKRIQCSNCHKWFVIYDSEKVVSHG